MLPTAAQSVGSIDLLRVDVNKCISLWPCEQLGDLCMEKCNGMPLSLWVCQPLAAQAWPQASGEPWFTVRAARKTLLCPELLLVVTLSLSKKWVVHRNQAFFTHKNSVPCYIWFMFVCIDWRKKTFCLTALCSWEIIYRNFSKIIPIYFYFSNSPG